MTLQNLHGPAGAGPTPERPTRRSLLAWTLAAAGGVLFAFVLLAVDALADLSAAVHLMA